LVGSADGTPIAFRRNGTGPPLVLVHGTTGSDWSWRFVEPLLAHSFTLYLMQRRGRGESGDGPEYSLEREAEDVAAVIDAVGAPANVFGHSFGGACAVEAALLTSNVLRLVLYEPPVEFPYPEGSIDRMERLASEGRADELLEEVFLSEGILTPQDIQALRSSPTWQDRVALAWTIPRESRADSEYSVSPERFARMTAPTLLLLGTASGEAFREATARVRAALPDVRLSMLEGQGHAATIAAPEMIADEVTRFFSE